MMGNCGLPGETGLSWESGTGKAGLSSQENWPVHGVDKHSIPWLVRNFCWELRDKNASSNLFRVVSARQVQALGRL